MRYDGWKFLGGGVVLAAIAALLGQATLAYIVAGLGLVWSAVVNFEAQTNHHLERLSGEVAALRDELEDLKRRG